MQENQSKSDYTSIRRKHFLWVAFSLVMFGAILYFASIFNDYAKKNDTEKGAFCVINRYGKTESAIKAYPQNVIFTKDDAPTVTYRCKLKKGGKYTLRVYTNPSNPAFSDNDLKFFVNTGTEYKEVNMIPEGFAIGDGQKFWGEGVLTNIRLNGCVQDSTK